MTTTVSADVCVVGGGYAGLMAARTITAAGRSVVVLEARDRVGGRVWTRPGPDGTHLDMGGAWLGPGQDSVRGLVSEFGVETYPTYEDGDKLFVVDGDPLRFRRSISEVVPAAAALSQYTHRLDDMAATLSVDEPWDSEGAEEWDGQSMAAWIRSEVKERVAAELLDKWIRTVFCVDLAEPSLLNVLWVIRSAGSLRVLLGTKGGYNQDHVHGGAQTMADRMAAELGDAVRLSSPARRIKQGSGGVTVQGDGVEVDAGAAIVALLPYHAAGLIYEPQLPTDRVALYQRSPNGLLLKSVAVYESPFWRADGLSGESIETSSLVPLTMDTSPEDGHRGVLTAYTDGPAARRLGLMPPKARRKVVLETFVARFGAKAASPIHYVDQDWAADEWSRGCHLVHYAGGVLTQYGRMIREPFERIHFAGAETATVSHGAIDGACRSGERAAQEVLAS
jgi:monoamine oxidase